MERQGQRNRPELGRKRLPVRQGRHGTTHRLKGGFTFPLLCDNASGHCALKSTRRETTPPCGVLQENSESEKRTQHPHCQSTPSSAPSTSDTAVTWPSCAATLGVQHLRGRDPQQPYLPPDHQETSQVLLTPPSELSPPSARGR
ncbi:hypothetical protein V5799_030822 [Amblyomma americanum]|uniref:Uncharacterized protein n=1 Tax=Amblyomma americanum TaxID=6943 RepID=A0AAQ4ELZ5_AMBAM